MNFNKNKTLGAGIWILTCLFLFNACAGGAGRGISSEALSKLQRYEDPAIGFAIAYDAQALTKDLIHTGPFVFRKESLKGMPSIGITAEPYPQNTALAVTADMISQSLPRLIPGCVIHKISNKKLFKLTDGTDANYFELDWTIDGSASIGAFVAARNNDRLFVFGAADRKQGSMQNLTTMVKSLQFEFEVDEAALQTKGFGREGKFVRTNSPAFTLDYPKAFENRPLLPHQIFRAGIPKGSPSISIGISPLRPGDDIVQQLKTMAEGYAGRLWSVGKDIEIITHHPIDLYKNFDAYQIRIAWRYRGRTPLATVVHLIAKENKAIRLSGHTVYSTDEVLEIFKTINLNPG